METNFFTTIEKLQVKANWKIVIEPSENDWRVGLVLSREGLNDDALSTLPAFTCKGTAAELDAHFFTRLETPAKRTEGLFSNAEQYNKELEQVRANTKMEKDKTTNEKKEKEGGNKQYEEKMKKVKALEDEGKYGQAIAQLPKVAEFPEFKEQIETKLKELKAKNGQLFD